MKISTYSVAISAAILFFILGASTMRASVNSDTAQLAWPTFCGPGEYTLLCVRNWLEGSMTVALVVMAIVSARLFYAQMNRDDKQSKTRKMEDDLDRVFDAVRAFFETLQYSPYAEIYSKMRSNFKGSVFPDIADRRNYVIPFLTDLSRHRHVFFTKHYFLNIVVSRQIREAPTEEIGNILEKIQNSAMEIRQCNRNYRDTCLVYINGYIDSTADFSDRDDDIIHNIGEKTRGHYDELSDWIDQLSEAHNLRN